MYEELIKAMRRNMVETGSLICLSCGHEHNCGTQGCAIMRDAAEALEAIRRQPAITGETSDGYHTFNELYHHRAVLFSVICNSRMAMAWKSRLHHDGTMYDGMFIVGINTPDGQATYHYDIDPYWEMFCVPELPQAPEWDGHTPAQAIERLGRLSAEPANEPLTCEDKRWVSVTERLPEEHDSIFAKRYAEGTQLAGMFQRVSDEVIVFGVYPDGGKFVTHGKTNDGKWNFSSIFQMTVTHWMPLPEPPNQEGAARNCE